MWIAFRIVFLLMIPNQIEKAKQLNPVVNCFQNCIFTYDSQRSVLSGNGVLGCELLSELYFYLWFPTDNLAAGAVGGCELLSELYFYLWFPTTVNNMILYFSLWIAFRIVFLLMIPNIRRWILQITMVVNCFQNCIFTYDSQQVYWYS